VRPTDFTFLIYVGLFMPYVIIRGTLRRKKVDVPKPSRAKLAFGTTVSLVVIGVMAIVTASFRGTSLFVPWNPTPLEAIAGASLLLGLLAIRQVFLPWIRKGRSDLVGYLLPRTWHELPMWTVVSVAAGFFEEIIYRGVLYRILVESTGSLPVAVVIVSFLFAIVHFSQGWRSMIFIAVLASTLNGLVIGFGTLYMAMLVHALYDFLVGVQTIPLAQRGLLPDQDSQSAFEVRNVQNTPAVETTSDEHQ